MNKLLFVAVFFGMTATGSPSRGNFLMSVGAYQSPDFENNRGTSQFHVDGSTHSQNPTYSISLSLTMPSLIYLDSSEGEGFMSPPSNNDPTTLFTGTAISTITLNGVVESFSDAYVFKAPPMITFPFTTPTFSGGPSVVFELGAYEVTVTPVASVGVREASFTLASVPEPSSWALTLIGSLAGWGFRRRITRHDTR